MGISGAGARSVSTRTALRASITLWTFGFIMVAALTTLAGRGPLWVQVPLQAGFWVTAIALAMLLHAVWLGLQAKPPLLRWSLMGLACLVVGAIETTVDLLVMEWLARTYFPEWRSWTAIDVPRFASVGILYCWTFGLNVALFWVLTANDETRRQAERAAAAEAAAQAAQLTLLRLQLNPHFLFNTLNAISGLMLENDIASADRMLTRLSEFLRASLDIDPAALTALGDEFNTAEAYLQIEAVRFEGRLNVTYDCPDGLRTTLVPGFILQPLVENAIKHAVAPALRTIQLAIAARRHGDDLVLTVSDDGETTRKARAARGQGVGLRNIEARLAALYGDRGRLVARRLKTGFQAELTLPLSYADDVRAAAVTVGR